MKFNWGTGLLIGALLFMTFVVVLVVKIMQTDVPLVETDYYEKGVNYQKIIDKSVDADKLLSIYLNQDKTALNFKKLINTEYIHGIASFYRPSNKKKDFKLNFLLTDSIPFAVDLTNFDKGIWKISVNWKDKTGEHFTEKEFNF